VLAKVDAALLRLLVRGEFAIGGMTARAVHALLPDKTSGQISRLLKRMRVHGLLKKIGRRYKYYLTDWGREVVTLALKLRELYIMQALAH
jgi:hypothetical protein